MSRYDEMLSYVSLDYHTSKIYTAILTVEGSEFDLLRQNIEDLRAQFFLDTATWGLQFWEKEYGLKVNTELSYSERRSRIKAKKRGIGRVGDNLVALVAGSFNNNQASVGFDGKISVELTRTIINALNLKDLQDAIEEIIPAHLNYTLGVKYVSQVLVKSEFLQNVPSELVFCGEIVCGAYPEANTAKEYPAGVRIASLYSTSEQAYKICGTFMSGDNTEITNDAKSYSGSLNMSASYSTAQQNYPVCGEFICGEGKT